jgi:outer membrane protein assembly factor BamB
MMRGKIYILSEFAADDPALVVFDIQTGDAKFHNIPVYGSLSVDERTGNVLLLGADTNTVYVIDPLTTYAAHHIATINSSSYISPYTSNSIVYDNIIYALTLNGEIYGFDLDTGAEVFYLALDIDTNNGGTAEFVVAPRCVEWEV